MFSWMRDRISGILDIPFDKPEAERQQERQLTLPFKKPRTYSMCVAATWLWSPLLRGSGTSSRSKSYDETPIQIPNLPAKVLGKTE